MDTTGTKATSKNGDKTLIISGRWCRPTSKRVDMAKNFSIVMKGTKKMALSIKKRNDTAAFRTVNILEKRAMKAVGKEVRALYPIKQKDIKKTIRVSRAKMRKPVAKWAIRSPRFPLQKVRPLKKGISFTGFNKVRHKMTEPVDGGSRPFVITGRYSGKQVAVYRKAGIKRDPVTTMKGYSVPKLFETVDPIKVIREVWRVQWAMEYGKQLDRAKY